MHEDYGFPEELHDASYEDIKRFANIRVMAETLLVDSRKTSELLGGTQGEKTPEQAWAIAEKFYDEKIGNGK